MDILPILVFFFTPMLFGAALVAMFGAFSSPKERADNPLYQTLRASLSEPNAKSKLLNLGVAFAALVTVSYFRIPLEEQNVIRAIGLSLLMVGLMTWFPGSLLVLGLVLKSGAEILGKPSRKLQRNASGMGFIWAFAAGLLGACLLFLGGMFTMLGGG